MGLEIHLYGKLSHYAKGPRSNHHSLIIMEPRASETIASLLEAMGIPVGEVNHIFFNSKLLVTRTRVGSLMGYQQARSDLFDWDLDVPVGDGDRIGLFGVDMPLLGM